MVWRSCIWLLVETAKLVPVAIFLILWMVILSTWLAPYIDSAAVKINEAMCATGISSQCPPVCEYTSQKGCVRSATRF